MIEVTQRYIRSLQRDNVSIMLPTPALAEYLVKFPPDRMAEQLAPFARNFIIQGFDLPSCVMAARLAHEFFDVLKRKRPKEVGRQEFKIDFQVVAIAIVHNATAIVTGDAHLQDIAGKRIKVMEVPNIAEQIPLLEVPPAPPPAATPPKTRSTRRGRPKKA